MGELFQPWHLLVLLFIGFPLALMMIVPYWVIFQKAGFPGVLSLTMAVPLVNLVVLYIVAFSKWPNAGSPGQNWTSAPPK